MNVVQDSGFRVCGLVGFGGKEYGYMPPKGPQTLVETILLRPVISIV